MSNLYVFKCFAFFYELVQMNINLRVTLGFLSCIYGRSICRALQREDLGSMCFPIGEKSIRRVGQARTRQCTPPICALPRCTGSVLLSQCARTVCCSPRAVGPAELSAGHAVVQGQRPQTGTKWILCENGQVLGGIITRFDKLKTLCPFIRVGYRS